MSMYVAGGKPYVFHKEPGDRTPCDLPVTLHLYVSGAAGTKIYFTKADFENDEAYITLPQSGAWEGPAAVRQVWISGTARTEVVGLALTR